MDFRQLRYFVEIVRQGSFGKAARSLALTQPAISRQILLLEKELNQELLIRGQSVELTEAGKIVFDSALKVTDELRELQSKLSNQSTSLSGIYSISTGATVAACILPSILMELRSFYSIQFRVLEGDFRTTLEALISGQVDLGILTGPVNRSGILEELFFEDEIIPVVSKNHPLASKKKITKELLRTEDFALLHRGSAIRREFDRTLSRNWPGFEPKVAMEFSSMESVLRTVQSGLGIGIMSSLFLDNKLKQIQIPELQTKRKIFFCMREARKNSVEPLVVEIRKLMSLNNQ